MTDRKEVARRIVDQLVGCDVKLVASLPDNWIAELIVALDEDERIIRNIPVNRKESAIGLCSGAYLGAMGSAALMGASGLMTVIYAITKINYSYEIPLLLLTTLRGAQGDHHKPHLSNGLYLLPVLDAISLPHVIIDEPRHTAGLVVPTASRAWAVAGQISWGAAIRSPILPAGQRPLRAQTRQERMRLEKSLHAAITRAGGRWPIELIDTGAMQRVIQSPVDWRIVIVGQVWRSDIGHACSIVSTMPVK